MKIKGDNLCIFSKKEEETILHFFCNCDFIQKMLQELKEILVGRGVCIQLVYKNFIFGSNDKKSKGVYELFLETKRYIYLCKQLHLVIMVIRVAFLLTGNFIKTFI